MASEKRKNTKLTEFPEPSDEPVVVKKVKKDSKKREIVEDDEAPQEMTFKQGELQTAPIIEKIDSLKTKKESKKSKKDKKEKKDKKAKSSEKHSNEANIEAAPLPLELLQAAEEERNQLATAVNVEVEDETDISPDRLIQRNAANARKRKEKKFDDIKVKVLDSSKPWSLPPFKIDSGAEAFRQHALYNNHNVPRKSLGAAPVLRSIRPAANFARRTKNPSL